MAKAKTNARLQTRNPSRLPNRNKKIPKPTTKKASPAAKKSKTQSKSSNPSTPAKSPTAKPSSPLRGISKTVNGETVRYLVCGDNHVRIYSGICQALATAHRNEAFKERLSQIEGHPTYSILRFQGRH